MLSVSDGIKGKGCVRGYTDTEVLTLMLMWQGCSQGHVWCRCQRLCQLGAAVAQHCCSGSVLQTLLVHVEHNTGTSQL